MIFIINSKSSIELLLDMSYNVFFICSYSIIGVNAAYDDIDIII